MTVMEKEFLDLKKEYEELQEELQKVKNENTHLKEVEEIYRTSLSLTDHVVTYIDIPSRTLNHIYREATFDAIHEVMENAPDSVLDTGVIPPEDVATFRQFYDDVYSGKPSGESGIFKTTEGDRRGYVRMLYKTIFDKDGNPSKAVVFSDDITSRVNAEKHYMEYRKAVMAGVDHVWEANLTKDQLISEDNLDQKLWGRRDFEKYSDIISVSIQGVLDDYKDIVTEIFDKDNLIQAYESGKREFSLEYPLMGNDQKITWLHTKIYLISNMDSDLCAIICANDVSKRKEKENQLLQQAECDTLTGLLNRRSFQAYAEKHLQESVTGTSALMIIDVDDFKQMNDRWGHIFGDSVLTLISDTMKNCFRQGDFISRIGGDEFMILANGRSLSIQTLEDRLMNMQRLLKNTPTPDNGSVDITLSIGVAIIHNGETFEDIYDRADKILYEVKRQGKNGFKVVA